METVRPIRHKTAAERRNTIIDAAIVEFAQTGLHGTATEAIARRAGISQPYIFRLFDTKQDLFVAAADRVYERISQLFRQAADEAQAKGENVLDAMAVSYNQLLSHREELLMLLQMFAAAGDPVMRERVGASFERLFQQTQVLAQVDGDTARAFFAMGMLCTVVTALDRPGVMGFPDWDTFFSSGKSGESLLFRRLEFSSLTSHVPATTEEVLPPL